MTLELKLLSVLLLKLERFLVGVHTWKVTHHCKVPKLAAHTMERTKPRGQEISLQSCDTQLWRDSRAQGVWKNQDSPLVIPSNLWDKPPPAEFQHHALFESFGKFFHKWDWESGQGWWKAKGDSDWKPALQTEVAWRQARTGSRTTLWMSPHISGDTWICY